MIPLFKSAKSISGHPLAGNRIMRIIYLDEAGTSANEPVTIVVGAILNADKQVIEIEQFLNSLKAKYIPEKDWDAFIFHAKDIFHGSGYFSDREKWSFERRENILKDIMGIFMRYQTPISIGYFIDPDVSAGRSIIIRHAMAYMECFAAAEKYMREFANDEIAMVIAEDHPTMKKYLKDVHHDFVGSSNNPVKETHKDIIPIRHIHGTINFAEKKESALLQIADTFAFIIRRYLMSGNRVENLMEYFLPNYKNVFEIEKGVCGQKLIVPKIWNSDAILMGSASQAF